MSLSPQETHRLDLINALLRSEVLQINDRILHDDFSSLLKIIRDGHPGYAHLDTLTLEEMAQKKGLSIPSV